MAHPIIEKLEARNKIVSNFSDFGKSADDRLYENLIKILEKKLSVKSGRLVLDDDSIQQLGEIIRSVSQDYKIASTQNEISKILKSFDTLTDSTIKVSALLNDSSLLSDLNFNKEKKFIVNELAYNLGNAQTFEFNVMSEVRQIIARSIVGESTYSELKDKLRDALLSKNGESGIVGRYVNQITTDSVMRYTGVVNTKIKEKLNLNAIRYIGDLMETSRPQCIRWVSNGGIFLTEKTPNSKAMNLDKEIRWAKKYGSGYGKPGKSYYLDLNEDNFIEIRGGYGCLHEAIAFNYSEKKEAYSKKLQDIHQNFLDNERKQNKKAA